MWRLVTDDRDTGLVISLRRFKCFNTLLFNSNKWSTLNILSKPVDPLAPKASKS